MHAAKWIATLICLFLGVSLWAQKFTGTLTGTVTDQSGAAVAGAKVTVTSPATGTTRTTTTNGEGNFTFPGLNPDTYDVSASKQGFKQVVQQSVVLHVADSLALKIELPVGAATEKIEVVVSPTDVTVQTQSGEVSNVMLSEQVRELPLNGRSFVQLTTLVPGASVAESFDSKNKGLFSGVDISFSGSPSVDNQWTVDGASNNDIGSQRTILIYPSIDGIDEFKIQRNSYGPEYGGASGAQINIVTKSGGNAFHGDVFYSGRNAVLNARDFFLGGCTPGSPGCEKQALVRNDYGYTFGGPIKKDKIFFFWSQEWNVERRGRVHSHWVPTAQERNGDFNDLAAAHAAHIDPITRVDTCQGLAVPIDPATGAPFPGNIVPANRLSAAGQAYVAPVALPNISDLCAANNWISQVKIPVDWREENIRGDINLTSKNTLTLRYTQDKWLNFLHADEAAGLWGDSDFPALSDSWNQPGKMAVAKLTTTISSTAVNDFQFSWSGNRIGVSRAGDDPTLNDQINANLPRIFPYSDKIHTDQAPEPVSWTGAPSGTLGIISPWKNRQDLFVWKDDFSKVAGNHTFKAGFLYTRNAKDEEVGDEGGEFWGQATDGSPAMGYQDVPWGIVTPAGDTGNFYADYLLKGELFGYDENQADAFALVRWRDYEFYAGDTWKANRRLTLNYGVRWSLIRPTYLDDNQLSGFSPEVYAAQASIPGITAGDVCRGTILAKGADGSGCATLGSLVTNPPHFENRSLVHFNNHMVAPRFGFAWDVFGTQRFVFRGGVGQFVPRDRLLAISMRSNSPPFGVNTSAERTLDGPFTGTAGNCVNQGCAFDVALGGAPHQGLDPGSNQANSWQWNLTTETALWRNAKLELAWVANRGIHLQNAYDANQIPKAFRLQAAQLAVVQGDTSSLKPYPYNSSGQMTIWSHTGDSIYHSLQSMFTTKLHRHSMFQLAYTFSKALGNTTFGYVDTDTVFSDNTNPRTNRGPVDFDRRHVLSANLIYNFPEFAQSNAALRQLIGGWETSTIVNYASGPALTIQGSNGFGDLTGTAASGLFTQRPLRVYSKPCHLSSSPTGQWLNPAAFTWNGYQLGTFGNTGPGSCAGPPINNVDFSIDKNFNVPFVGGSFGERAKLQFRMDFFNVFNHPQFKFGSQNLAYSVSASSCQYPDGSSGCMTLADVGKDGGTYPADASGTPCANNPPSCTAVLGGILDPGVDFGRPHFTSQTGNREMQFGLKLIF